MKMITPMDVGHFIASTRKAKQWSQAQLAQKIGKDQRFVSKLENDPSSVAFGTVMAALNALGVKMELNNDASMARPPGKKVANDKQGSTITGRTGNEYVTVVGKESGRGQCSSTSGGASNGPSSDPPMRNRKSGRSIFKKPSIVTPRPGGKK